MCCNCGDWIDQCYECGHIDATGRRRAKHFWVDGKPLCEHLAPRHDESCPARRAGFCTYEGRCDPDFDESATEPQEAPR